MGGFDDNQTVAASMGLSMPKDKKSTNEAESSATTKPGSAATTVGLQAFRSAVEEAERDVHGISGDALQHTFAPTKRIIENVSSSIGSRLTSAVEALKKNPANPEDITPLARRLGDVLGVLSAIARQHKVEMADVRLDVVFDYEDEIRLAYTGLGRANRADNYYDENLAPVTHSATPTAESIGHALNDETAAPPVPQTRDQLVEHIVGFAATYQAALNSAVDLVTAQITEPNQPKRPDLLETLLDIATSVLTAQAMSALGLVLQTALKAAAAKVNAEEHVGTSLSEMLIDGFKDSGKETIVGAVTPAPQPPANDEKTGLAAKTGFVVAVKKRTHNAGAIADGKFKGAKPMLNRTPVETLRAVSEAFDQELADRIGDRYGDLVVHQWVNYMKDAFAEGEDLRDTDKRSKGASKLDSLDPPGLLTISVRVEDGNQFHLARAALPGVGDAVLAHVRAEKRNSLGSAPLYRRIEAFTPGESVWLDGFNLDPKGKLTAELSRVSKQARLMWAKFVNQSTTDEVSDGEVYAGMKVVQTWLNTVPTEKIEGPE